MPQGNKRLKVFIGCSTHKEDQACKEELKKHLAPMNSGGVIEIWDQSSILGGDVKSEEIKDNLRSAQIIMLLISADFFHSELCTNIMQQALDRHHNENDFAVIIPVFLRKVQWSHSSLYKLKVVPSETYPIKSNHWFTVDDAYFKVVDEIAKVVDLLRKPTEPQHDVVAVRDNTVVMNANIRDYKDAIQLKNVHSSGSFNDSGGLQSGSSTAGLEDNNTIDELIDVTGEADRLSVADVEFTRAELLLKKGIILHKKALREEDEQKQLTIMNNAYSALVQAKNIEPRNVEILLEMAKLLIVLTPDDTEDEEMLLLEITEIADPQNENETFCLAQAQYLLATSDLAKIDIYYLKNSRDLFNKLGQKEWVKDCEQMLHYAKKRKGEEKRKAKEGQYQQPTQDTFPQNAYASNQQAVNQTQHYAALQNEAFNPIGNWSIQVRSMIPNTMRMQIYPNGSISGTQKLVINFPFQGTWSFFNNVLSVQATMAGNWTSFAIQILHFENGNYHGRGNDGINYIFTREG